MTRFATVADRTPPAGAATRCSRGRSGLIGGCHAAIVSALLLAAIATPSHAAEPETTDAFDHAVYARVLREHVNDAGRVDYAALKRDRADLDAYVKSLGEVSPARFRSWGDDEKLAFLINAYNAFTLQAVIDHYPIRSGFLASLIYPTNSIRQIDGVWDELTWDLAGETVTIEQIEHEKIRGVFAEPRIHTAINCASIGCPPLRTEPYTGEALDAQLDDQAARFLRDSDSFRIDRRQRRVYLSPVFDWFGDDWVAGHRPASGYAGSEAQKSVLHFIAGYLSDDDAEYLRRGGYRVRYLDYDWTLNEQ